MDDFNLFDNSINLASINSPGYEYVSPGEFEVLVKDSKEWGEIKELAENSQLVKDHLDQLLTAVKLVKG